MLETFKLSPEEFDAISKLHQEPGKYMVLCQYGETRSAGREVPGQVLGWTYEQLGWDPKAFANW